MAQVPAGMREAYEPSWYRITLAQGETRQRASDEREAGSDEPGGRRCACSGARQRRLNQSRRAPTTAR